MNEKNYSMERGLAVQLKGTTKVLSTYDYESGESDKFTWTFTGNWEPGKIQMTLGNGINRWFTLQELGMK